MVGFNYRMTDIQAAIGSRQLRRLDEIVERRRALAARYATLLAHLPLEASFEPEWARSNWQSYGVGLPEWADQAGVMQAMLDRGVSSRRGVMCSHLELAYADARREHLPPVGGGRTFGASCCRSTPQMTEADQDAVAAAVEAALGAEPAAPTGLAEVA